MQLFDIERFCMDNQIPTAPVGHKHYRPGWVAIICPFCEGNPGWHLGYNKTQGFWTCYRCGWWPHDKVMAAITGIDDKIALNALIRPYRMENRSEGIRGRVRKDPLIYGNSMNLPPGCGPMTDRHKEYLIGRNYDPDLLERRWELKGTDHTGPYKFRVIAPIYFNRQLVSYQGRDITGKQELPYKACAEENEYLHHKHTLYGIDNVPGDTCVIVEGITGVWRLGYGAVATFGAKVTNAQLRMLLKFKRIFTMFDPDPAGEQATERVCSVLGRMGKEVEILDLANDFDSGNLPQDLANKWMQEVLK